MKSRWNDAEAARAVDEWKVSEALALRTYSARLLGSDPSLVLHGGGNTSVKAKVTTILGDTLDVLHIKGSGWDLATIQPPGHPAVRMDHLRRMLALADMTDEQMVNELRLALLDASAPTPSVEALLHAALPATYIDHTHADAILAIVDQPDRRKICEDLYGDDLLWIPYVMPGFRLAKAFTGSGKVILLERHGIFTYGDTAKESYERMIEAVTKAEQYKPKTSVNVPVPVPETEAWPLGVIRGAMGMPIVRCRMTPTIAAFLERADATELSQRGCATPDHVIRTKPWPLHLEDPPSDPASFRAALADAIGAYTKKYDAYFEAERRGRALKKLDPKPRVLLVPRLGLCTVGKTKAEADIAADVYEHTIDVILHAEGTGAYAPLGLADLFDVEYWSLEQAKIKKVAEAPLARRVALVTGAASGIGKATAELFAELGAHVVTVDRTNDNVSVVADVTDAKDVDRAFDHALREYGGVDIVVSNAGSAAEGKLETKEGEDALRKSLELNLLAHVNVARSAVRTMRLHGHGGSLLFNASKSAFNQGPGFGPYAVPKAALVSLMRQYAVDLAPDRIRSNAVNADRVRTAIFGGGMVESRAKARGISVDEYFRTNLLQHEVTARDVAEAFVYLAKAEATTGCVITVDGGNASAFPR